MNEKIGESPEKSSAGQAISAAVTEEEEEWGKPLPLPPDDERKTGQCRRGRMRHSPHMLSSATVDVWRRGDAEGGSGGRE